MKLAIASDFIEELSDALLKNSNESLPENRIKEIEKYIDIAIDPNSYKSKGKGSKEFINLCTVARSHLFNLCKNLDQPSHSQKNIYELIENLNLVISGVKTNIAIQETNHSVKKLTGFFTGLVIDKNDEQLNERIRSSLETAFYDFYGIEMEENSQESTENILERLSKAYQTLSFLRELIRRNASPNEITIEAIFTIEKFIGTLEKKIDKLKLER